MPPGRPPRYLGLVALPARVRRLVPLLVLVAALAAAYGLAACQASDSPAVAGDASWAYVGDGACQQCHADLATSYAQTGMGRSVSPFDAATAPERFGPDGASPVVCADDGYCYQAFVRADTLVMRETRPDTPDHVLEQAVTHVVGSGNATRSYLLAAGGGRGTDDGAYLTEMPLTWYVERALWDLSPGYQRNNQRFDRPIALECLTCHASRPGHDTSQNFYTSEPLAIGCERCHGPGSAHVAAFEAGGSPSETQIVNPAALTVGRQLDVCQQCHLTGETVYAVGEDPTTYRPGRPLAAHRTVFATQASLDDPDDFGIASHAERMMRSECFTESIGTDRPMTCTTCHDPHVATAQLPADAFNASCQSCHGDTGHLDACSRPAVDAEAAMGGDCVGCHLRTGGTSDIPHVSFTDHWIRRDPPPSSQGRSATGVGVGGDAPFQLVTLTAVPETRSRAEADALLAMATFVFWETRHTLPQYLPEIAGRLRSALASGLDRTDARVTLGRALIAMDSVQAARSVLADAVTRDPDDAYAQYWRGVADDRAGAREPSLDALRRSVALAPHLTEARARLGEELVEAGRWPEAAQVLAEAVRRDPLRHAGAWNNLGFARLNTGDLAGALAALRRSVALDPRSATARANLGAALLSSGDADAARAQFQAALRVDPSDRASLGNLGLIASAEGRTADARAFFQRVLALDPTDGRARAALDALDR